MYVIIAGVGIIGSQVTKALTKNKHDVVIIDLDSGVCENIYSETGATSIHGNATELKVLKEAGADKADFLLCLMRKDADNISASLLAKSLGVPKVLACIRKPQYEEAYKLAGIDIVIRMTDLMINQIIVEVEQPKIKKIMKLGAGKAEIYVVTIPQKSKSIGKTIMEIAKDKKFPEECLIMGIYRNDTEEFNIPRGNNIINALDQIFIVSKAEYIKQVTDYLFK